MSSGSAISSRSGTADNPIAGSARLPTITGCTNSTATCRASERAAGEVPSAISRPPRAKRSAILWQSLAIRSASAVKNASFARVRRAMSCAPGSTAWVMPAPRRARPPAPATRAIPRTPSPVRALTSRRLGTGIHLLDVVQEAVEIEVEVGEQVDLVHQHQLARAEHQRVLERLVLSLRDGGDHHPRVLSDLELRRAHEVADVLDHEQVDLVQRQGRDRRADHVRVEVTLSAETGIGVDLRHRHVQAREPVGIEAALHVSFQHGDPDAVEVMQDALQQRRLAGAGGAHHVDDANACPVEVGAVRLRDGRVRVERVFGDLDLGLVQLLPPTFGGP